MGYVPGLAHDVFLSYAHGDNETGWVTYFETRLRQRLRERLGFTPEVWRDERKLGGGDSFPDEIKQALSATGIVVSVVSPSYLVSEYCRRERIQFNEALKARSETLQVGNRFRLVKVIKTPSPGNMHRQLLPKALGFDFFTEDPAPDACAEFAPGSREFETALDRIAAWLAETISPDAQPETGDLHRRASPCRTGSGLAQAEKRAGSQGLPYAAGTPAGPYRLRRGIHPRGSGAGSAFRALVRVVVGRIRGGAGAGGSNTAQAGGDLGRAARQTGTVASAAGLPGRPRGFRRVQEPLRIHRYAGCHPVGCPRCHPRTIVPAPDAGLRRGWRRGQGGLPDLRPDRSGRNRARLAFA